MKHTQSTTLLVDYIHFFYPSFPTEYVKSVIRDVLSTEDTTTGAANMVCQYLQLDKSTHRKTISNIIKEIVQ